MARFDYILDKIETAPATFEPFRHIHIEGLFTDSDFAEIIACPEINIPSAQSDDDLFEKMYESGYKVIDFPGCITNQQEYADWHRTKSLDQQGLHSACEGFGMTLRLISPESKILKELKEFLAGDDFNKIISKRCGINLSDCTIDGGIQKYLDGYEISPHPDIRRKAGTFLVNINPGEGSEQKNHHTKFLKLKPEYQYVKEFWQKTAYVDRCWVPWSWCDIVKTQPSNNSMVIFAPSDDTMHAVKADYDHLNGQRTQLYGNLWYTVSPKTRTVEWEQLAGKSIETIQVDPPENERLTVRGVVKAIVPAAMRTAVKTLLPVGGGKGNVSENYYERKY